MKLFSLIVAVALLSTTACQAQIKNAKTATVTVYGNCEMCEISIEKAANKSKISTADWNEENKMATITYDSKKTSIDAVLKNIALAGYDNQSSLAPDAAYTKLPGCCKYDRERKTLLCVKQELWYNFGKRSLTFPTVMGFPEIAYQHFFIPVL